VRTIRSLIAMLTPAKADRRKPAAKKRPLPKRRTYR